MSPFGDEHRDPERRAKAARECARRAAKRKAGVPGGGLPRTGKLNRACIIIRRLIEECCPENWEEEEALRPYWRSAADFYRSVTGEMALLPGEEP